MMCGVIRFIFLCPAFLLATVFFPAQVAHPDNGVKNTVVLSFEDITFNRWNAANKTSVLRVVILDAINGFCPHDPSKCYLKVWNDSRKFDNKHVVVTVESATEESKNLYVKVFIFLPDGKDIQKDGHSVMAGSVLQEILLSYKHNLTFAIGAEVKYIGIDTNLSNNTSADNKMNYIMIPITFAVLVVLCCLACFLHFSSKRRQKAIEKQRIKQLRLNKLRHSTANGSEGQTQNTAGNETHTTVTVHEEIRDKSIQHQCCEGDDHSKRKKRKIKHRKHQRVTEEKSEESAMEPTKLGVQWVGEKSERIPTPIPHHRTVHHTEEEKKHNSKKKQRKTHEFKTHNEGYSEGNEIKQPTEQTSEDLLIQSLPRPRKLVPLQERTEVPL